MQALGWTSSGDPGPAQLLPSILHSFESTYWNCHCLSRGLPPWTKLTRGKTTEITMFRPLTWGWKSFRPRATLLSMRSTSSVANSSLKLINKVAVVTGSTNGIGFSIARRLAQEGAHVIISSRKQQNVDQAVDTLQREGLSVAGTVCHVGKAEDQEQLVATALKHCGGVDFLVCTAGVNPFVGSTLGSNEQVWDKVRSGALTFYPLCPPRQGSVVLVSSVAAYVPLALGAYNVSKTALLGLTKTLAVELAPKNIRVNCLVPGFIKTDFSRVVSTEKSFLGKPEDCAGLVSFLCSPDASYITGENIVIAGFSPHL
uniref:Dehydrogenase/reductase SDR family member 4 n=1 Tax=Spermophilus dauricus TaxID=99837 RepID=A0A8C9PE84_SPEDA